jgi:hypothetical protein
MSITIKLDGQALAALIDGNDEFRLELQRAVIAEVTRKLYLNDVTGDVQKLINAAFKKHKDDLIQAVKDDEVVRKLMEQRIGGMIQSVRSGTFGYATQKTLSPELQSMINVHVNNLVQDECNRQLGSIPKLVEKASKDIEEQVLTRIGKISGVIAHNTKVEMLRQVREDVTKTIMEKLGS